MLILSYDEVREQLFSYRLGLAEGCPLTVDRDVYNESLWLLNAQEFSHRNISSNSSVCMCVIRQMQLFRGLLTFKMIVIIRLSAHFHWRYMGNMTIIACTYLFCPG